MNTISINNKPTETNFTGILGCSVKRCIRKSARVQLQYSIDYYSKNTSNPDKNIIREKKKYYRNMASDIIKQLKRYCKKHTRWDSILTIVPASSGSKAQKELVFYAPQNPVNAQFVNYGNDPKNYSLSDWQAFADRLKKYHRGYTPADLPWAEQERIRKEGRNDQAWFEAHYHWGDSH